MRILRAVSWTPVSMVAACVAVVLSATAAAQPAPAPPTQSDQFEAALSTAVASAHAADPPATLVYANRPIVQLRATVLTRTPASRVASIIDLLDRLVREMPDAQVTTRAYGDTVVVSVNGQPVLAILPQDADQLTGERPATKAADAAARLQVALNEIVELRTPGRLLRSGLLALAATVLFVLALFIVFRVNGRLAARASRAAESRLNRLPGATIITRVADAHTLVRRVFMSLSLLLSAVLAYWWLAGVLRSFPYTRPLGESLRSGLFSAVAKVGRGVVDQLPNALTLLVIFVVVRFFARLINVVFDAAEKERLKIPWVYPETAQPTRRIAIALLWVFALVVSYKYLPGSDTDAFKGVSVFIGLIISLGSTGVMNQAMSGLMLMYARALRPGDFVKVADVEGTVVHLGALSTKIRTNRNEEITIPNAIVVSHATTNYSRNAESGVLAPTSVTIGYDVPWRQVHALLLLAAERTPGVRQDPKPVVLQVALADFYVQYTLLVCVEQPQRRVVTLAALHANIQDAFNEFGVQIMSPNYEADPGAPKVVPRNRWYSAPAKPAAEGPDDPAAAQRAEAEYVGPATRT